MTIEERIEEMRQWLLDRYPDSPTWAKEVGKMTVTQVIDAYAKWELI
jgi:hypothetical protein